MREEGNPQVVTQVVEIPHLPISFERNSDLSSLSWEAVDRRLPLDVIREKFRKLTAKPRMDPMFCPVYTSDAADERPGVAFGRHAPIQTYNDE